MFLTGKRLFLRPPVAEDAAALAAINGDAEVMRHFVTPQTREESDAMLARIMAHHAEHGFGFWTVERKGQPGLIGLVGLSHVGFEAGFTPAVEIGWRIAPAHQRQGYAEEAARMALAAGFGPLGLREIVAWTIPANETSWRLMERLGMAQDGEFEHPKVPEGHPKRRHVLYRISAA
ncbi:GNAT family N-acetyltransferase [Roseococcus sp. YIM B11640]|uniref:GNAT family N-acetyltransferase n=1 Tax=Roseococcus sp. YIM B11640 TaxID=3133973 RepID=UPI003C7A66EA